MSKLYMATFNFGQSAKNEQIQAALDVEPDWLRINPNTYLVWSGKSAQQIYEGMASVLTQDDKVMVMRLDPLERWGFEPSWVWAWTDAKARNEDTRVLDLLPATQASPKLLK